MRAGDPFFAIWKILAVQASVVIALPALLLVVFGWLEARSGLFGGLIGLIPNAYLALRIAATKGKTAKVIVRAFYSGESIKIIITAGLFIFVFQLPNILYGPLFAVFIAVIFVFWFALLFSRTESE
ncbi:MAG: ATP synthase subunit I [Methylococcaceae bacterium]|nr:ATP synthase subunit I [Methylococcaceae bacterium]MCI0733840.1 ATP synthase subunit I [Methylococcaceae bacterium]